MQDETRAEVADAVFSENGFKSIELANNLGQLAIKLPSSLDTSYLWIDYSDNNCSHRYKYRYSNKDFPIFKESGFARTIEVDSFFQFTISQYCSTECPISPKSEVGQELLNACAVKLSNKNPGTVLRIKELMEINGRRFVVIATSLHESNMENNYILAITIVGHRYLDLEFQCQSFDCFDFLDTMISSLRTTRIIESQDN